MFIHIKKFAIFLFVIFSLMIATQIQSQPAKISDLDKFAIQVKPNESRPFVFSDRAGAFYYGECNDFNRSGHQGFYIGERKFLNEYLLFRDDSLLKRDQAQSIVVHLDKMERKYKNGVVEELFLVDGKNILIISLKDTAYQNFNFIPFAPEKMSRYFQDDRFLLFAKQNSPPKQKKLAIYLIGDGAFSFDEVDLAPLQGIIGFPLCRIKLRSKEVKIAIFAAENTDDARKIAQNLDKNLSTWLSDSRKRLKKLLNHCYFHSDDSLLNLAFCRALISLDQLIIHDQEKKREKVGIYAGLPWFNNYWGRDTFISFAGAVLVTGRYEEAKQILRSFADYQNRDSTSSNWGRIPNRVTEQEVIYNTADGTPWFVKALWDYFLHTGDRKLLCELFSVIDLSVQGTLRYHTDSLGFLTHGDAETWMDAKGGQGAWSPRGNRAVEIQILWINQLKIAAQIADICGYEKKAKKWLGIARKTSQNFIHYFWDDSKGVLYDHLNEDGTPDKKIRPNQIFALTVPQFPLLKAEQKISVLREVVTRLTYPYGVASLWQHDADFHPYHQLPEFYPKDAAYHNGTVWTWLAGPVISALSELSYDDLAFALLKNEAEQILNIGGVGTYHELLDALPREGEIFPHWSGTVSQAWSLAEFIRNFYQDFLGIRFEMAQDKDEFLLRPIFMKFLKSAKFRIPVQDADIYFSFARTDKNTQILAINYRRGERIFSCRVQHTFPDEKLLTIPVELLPGKKIEIRIVGADNPRIFMNNKPQKFFAKAINTAGKKPELSFAQPELDTNLVALKSPDYALLSGEQVTQTNSMAKIVIDVEDALFDDVGQNGKYQYPQSNYFQPGILDLTHFKVAEDASNYYFELQFRNLVQPGWHPEYGFQLTYVAIAIAQNLPDGGQKVISHNANFALPSDFVAHKVIFVGGGIEIEDEHGEIIAAYRPVDEKFAIGDVSKRQVRFSLPKKILGDEAQKWQWAVLVGAQDDHGGAGIGEFREVARKASEWKGGGAEKDRENCNVYDFLFVER